MLSPKPALAAWGTQLNRNLEPQSPGEAERSPAAHAGTAAASLLCAAPPAARGDTGAVIAPRTNPSGRGGRLGGSRVGVGVLPTTGKAAAASASLCPPAAATAAPHQEGKTSPSHGSLLGKTNFYRFLAQSGNRAINLSRITTDLPTKWKGSINMTQKYGLKPQQLNVCSRATNCRRAFTFLLLSLTFHHDGLLRRCHDDAEDASMTLKMPPALFSPLFLHDPGCIFLPGFHPPGAVLPIPLLLSAALTHPTHLPTPSAKRPSNLRSPPLSKQSPGRAAWAHGNSGDSAPFTEDGARCSRV